MVGTGHGMALQAGVTKSGKVRENPVDIGRFGRYVCQGTVAAGARRRAGKGVGTSLFDFIPNDASGSGDVWINKQWSVCRAVLIPM